VHEVSSGTVRPAEVTLSAVLNRWLELVGDDLSPTTLREYRRLIDRRIRPALGDLNISKLTTATLDAFYQALARHARLAPGEYPADPLDPPSGTATGRPLGVDRSQSRGQRHAAAQAAH
jgi:hypothetical protein